MNGNELFASAIAPEATPQDTDRFAAWLSIRWRAGPFVVTAEAGGHLFCMRSLCGSAVLLTVDGAGFSTQLRDLPKNVRRIIRERV